MNTQVVIIVIVAFLALDILFYYLIIKRMDRPSPSAAFARARGFSLIPDAEGESVGIRLRERLPLGGGELSDIVRLPLAEAEGYLFTTLPQADSHLPRGRENQRQFIAVLLENPLDGGLFIHPPFRPPFSGFKRRRLLAVFKTTTYRPVSADRLPPALAGRFRVLVESEKTDPGLLLTPGAVRALTNAPRKRGFALWAGPGGLIVYINPLLAQEGEVGRFYGFTAELARALSRGER